MKESTCMGFKLSETIHLIVVLSIPFLITQNWFFYTILIASLSYCLYYIHKKFTERMIQIKGQGVLITGCDSGFGYGLAKRLDALGFTVFAGCLIPTGDGAVTLRSSKTGRMHVIEMDVTKDESVSNAVKYVKKVVLETKCGLWAVVNNAGIQVLGEIEFCTMDLYYKVAEVNLFGMVRTTKALLPLLRKSKGRVINVTSVKGQIGVPANAAYGITKYGGETFSDILRLEMRKFGVKVIVIEPGHFAGVTGILNSENLARLKKETDAMWDSADDEVKATYGEQYYSALYEGTEGCKPDGCPTLDPALNAFVDAIINENPQFRYLVDGTRGYYDNFCVLARLNMYLPTGIMDYLRERYFLGNMAKIGR